jgi:hypothetical protein
MDIGMLWYDDDNRRSLNEKVARAVDFYKTKYGSPPTICFINPATLKGKAGPAEGAPALAETAGGVQLRTARNVLVDHFWLGVGEANGDGNGNGKGHTPSRRARAAGPRVSGRAPNGHSARSARRASVPA